MQLKPTSLSLDFIKLCPNLVNLCCGTIWQPVINFRCLHSTVFCFWRWREEEKKLALFAKFWQLFFYLRPRCKTFLSLFFFLERGRKKWRRFFLDCIINFVRLTGPLLLIIVTVCFLWGIMDVALQQRASNPRSDWFFSYCEIWGFFVNPWKSFVFCGFF